MFLKPCRPTRHRVCRTRESWGSGSGLYSWSPFPSQDHDSFDRPKAESLFVVDEHSHRAGAIYASQQRIEALVNVGVLDVGCLFSCAWWVQQGFLNYPLRGVVDDNKADDDPQIRDWNWLVMSNPSSALFSRISRSIAIQLSLSSFAFSCVCRSFSNKVIRVRWFCEFVTLRSFFLSEHNLRFRRVFAAPWWACWNLNTSLKREL